MSESKEIKTADTQTDKPAGELINMPLPTRQQAEWLIQKACQKMEQTKRARPTREGLKRKGITI